MTFALSSNSSTADIAQAVNYLIGTQPGVNSVAVNQTTGAIVNPYTQQNLGYTNQYVWFAYGTSITGENFSFSPTNATWIGIRNTNDGSTSSTNPADYTWQQATYPFGTTNELYYSTIGGRQIQLSIADVSPGIAFVLAPIEQAVNLDIVTVSASSISTGTATTAITVTGNAQPNITSVGRLTSLSVTGNVGITGFYIGRGNLLTGVHAVTVTANAQPNITSVGNLTSVVVNGNATLNGNASIGNVNTGNISAGNVNGAAVRATTLSAQKIYSNTWQIQEVGGNLLFSSGATVVMSLSPSGNLVLLGNVVTNGTPS